MITMPELLKSHKLEDLPAKHQYNLAVLLDRMNLVRAAYAFPMTVTSGYRSLEDHLRIYAAKGITDQSEIPMQSRHLTGEACDVADSSGKLNQWCRDNEEYLRNVGIWLEKRQGNWQHFQIKPFGSYKPEDTIWFNP